MIRKKLPLQTAAGLFIIAAVIFLFGCAGITKSRADGKPEGDGAPTTKTTERATFGAGCFWGVEAAFEELPGVIEAVSGYAGGWTEEPSYQQVCSGNTGHAEVVKVEFDPEMITYADLLGTFFSIHDPTRVPPSRQIEGYQYRSIILYHNPEQKRAAEKFLKEVGTKNKNEVRTEIVPLEAFYRAEEYHQNYHSSRSDDGYGGGVFLSCY